VIFEENGCFKQKLKVVPVLQMMMAREFWNLLMAWTEQKRSKLVSYVAGLSK